MTGPQTEIEIRLWRDEFARMRQTPEWTDAAMDAADDLLHRYRARYGQLQPTADDNLGRAAIEAMDAILGIMGDEDQSNQHKAAAIDLIATQYVAARWHIEKESGK